MAAGQATHHIILRRGWVGDGAASAFPSAAAG